MHGAGRVKNVILESFKFNESTIRDSRERGEYFNDLHYFYLKHPIK